MAATLACSDSSVSQRNAQCWICPVVLDFAAQSGPFHSKATTAETVQWASSAMELLTGLDSTFVAMRCVTNCLLSYFDKVLAHMAR